MTIEEILSETLQLPPDERERLAEALFRSLEADAEWERTWAAEARRRLDEMDCGRVAPIPAEEAMKQARAALWLQPIVTDPVPVACESEISPGPSESTA
ncbi:MAG TPA: addiction module protein [Armatimonadota bacterium]|nr:addiction module protein [Armatimonadota bacterium]